MITESAPTQIVTFTAGAPDNLTIINFLETLTISGITQTVSVDSQDPRRVDQETRDIYWVWGDGEDLEWGDGEIALI